MEEALSSFGAFSPPEDIHDILEREAEFNSDSYFKNFAPYYFTLVRGYREIEQLLLLDPRFFSAAHVSAVLFAERFTVPPLVPTQWKTSLGRHAKWGECRWGQATLIREGKPVRLDQLLQALLALAKVFSQSQITELQGINVFEYVKLVPATYAFDIKEKEKAKLMWLSGSGRSKDPDWMDLVRDLFGQSSGLTEDQVGIARSFLADVSNGYPLTWATASLIKPRLAAKTSQFDLRYLVQRNEAKRRPKKRGMSQISACAQESAFIRLSAEKKHALQKIVEQVRGYQASR